MELESIEKRIKELSGKHDNASRLLLKTLKEDKARQQLPRHKPIPDAKFYRDAEMNTLIHKNRRGPPLEY